MLSHTGDGDVGARVVHAVALVLHQLQRRVVARTLRTTTHNARWITSRCKQPDRQRCARHGTLQHGAAARDQGQWPMFDFKLTATAKARQDSATFSLSVMGFMSDSAHLGQLISGMLTFHVSAEQQTATGNEEPQLQLLETYMACTPEARWRRCAGCGPRECADRSCAATDTWHEHKRGRTGAGVPSAINKCVLGVVADAQREAERSSSVRNGLLELN